MLAAYSDHGWFIRTLRLFPVVAIAACAGGAIGGFIVFAINGALTPLPPTDLRADGPSVAAPIPAKPVAITDEATLDSSAKISAPELSAPQASGPSTAQPAPTRWPHAPWFNMSLRARKIAPPVQEPAQIPELGQGDAPKNAAMDRKDSDNASAPAEAARAAALRRAHAARKRERELSAAAAARQIGDRGYSGVYDYYGATTERDAGSPQYGASGRPAVRGRQPGQTDRGLPAGDARSGWQPNWGGWNGGGYFRGAQ